MKLVQQVHWFDH
jgi:hypothetical protein